MWKQTFQKCVKRLNSDKLEVAAGSEKLNSSASRQPPKISSRVNESSTAAAKRACLGGNYAKMRTAKAAPGKTEDDQECKTYHAVFLIFFVSYGLQLKLQSIWYTYRAIYDFVKEALHGGILQCH